MKESKIGATERLRCEGRWNEASTYRDEVRKRLRIEGKPKSEANELAWEAMFDKFTPQSVEANGDVAQDISPNNETAELLPGPRDVNNPDLVRDSLWVYENLENRRAVATEAPSLGAWGLLKWTRENPDRFFEHLFPKVIVAKQKQPESSDDLIEDPGIEEIERLLKEVQGSDSCRHCGRSG